MDEKNGMKKKPSAVSARPLVRAPSGRGPAAPASAGPPPPVQVQAAAPNMAETMQAIADGNPEPAPNVKAYIERQLKSVYDDVLNQPIPDRFLELLDTLDQSGAGDKPKTGDK
ncbi:MAG: Anti-sigma factor NepR [Pseudomonadota bacterium]